jgi:hypothetical protein
MRSRWSFVAALSTLLVFQTTVAIPQESCMTAETKQSLGEVIQRLGEAGAVIILVKEKGRLVKVGEALHNLSEIWTYAGPIVTVCAPKNGLQVYDKDGNLMKPRRPLSEQLRNPD